MSAVAPRRRIVRTSNQSPERRFWVSTIGLKILTAVTGVILSLFVLGHMAGNLQVFQGAEAIDAYARFLRVEPALLWLVRLALLTTLVLHIWAFLVLLRRNQGARPVGYRRLHYKESSYASRSMWITGPLVLLFIIYHILHMTTGTVHSDFHEGKVYQNLTTAFRAVPVVLIYLAGLAVLAFHLWHGIWSLFQTLGGNQPRYHSLGRKVSTIFTLVVTLGFAAVPLAILAGVVK